MSARRGQGQWLLLLAAAGVAVFLTWRMLQPFLSVLIWAAVLALLFHPLHRRILRRVRRPALAAALSILVVLVTVIVPLGLIGSAVAAELARFATQAQESARPWLESQINEGRLGEARTWLAERFGIELGISPEKIAELASNMSQYLLRGTVSVVGGLLGALTKLVLVLFTLYYFFRDGEGLVRQLPGVLPLSADEAEGVLRRTDDIIRASVSGTIVVAAIQGVLGGLMFAVLGLPSPLVWGVVMTLLSLIPMAGSFLVWGPAAILLAASGEWGKAIVLTAFGAGVIGVIDNLLRPRLVGQRARMHELTVFFTVLGGIQLFGMLGFLVGPVLFAVTLALLDIVRRSGAPAAAPAAASA
ncbi:MAG: AI-2E family transporter, partial [Thermoanaerobaculia bacterium]